MTEPTVFQRECAGRGWEQPREFLRAYAETAQLIGEDACLTDRQLRRWRQPEPPRPRAKSWRVLHAMFGISPLNLGFPGPDPTPIKQTREGTNVDRREFVTDTFGAAAGLALPSSPSPQSSDGVGSAHVIELRRGLQALTTLDDSHGGGDVRRLAARHLRRIRRVINIGSYSDSIGRQLHLLAGETAAKCGWVNFDAGRQDDARRYWGEALTTATMLRDASLEVVVMASLALQANYEGRGRDGYDLARAARERAERMRSPVLVSLLAAREARALALQGDRGGAKKSMAQAMHSVRHAGRGRPAPGWAAFHCQAEIEHAQGIVYADLGQYRAAVPFLRAALTHQDRSYGRNRALYKVTLARTLVQAGEIDEGASEAVDSLSHLGEVASGRVIARLGEVRTMLVESNSTLVQDQVRILNEHETAEV